MSARDGLTDLTAAMGAHGLTGFTVTNVETDDFVRERVRVKVAVPEAWASSSAVRVVDGEHVVMVTHAELDVAMTWVAELLRSAASCE
ncbi:hypothetical protein BH790_gp38 [Gordonia phage Gsput1]|uniref:Uncharacterized protein n=1 Tax=Gordonia phage Gsput1 TaxID=1622193 RepID=A0A0E3XA02_9CAUD|nr:hypothetical protein BH790_gp38 [Gordonia phage Gsput1]AKC03063.1 hypothetical protein Gsput1_38 [Gordonia phage Gsput1]